MQTIEKALSTRNLTEACREVVKNKGTGGVDGMSVKQLKTYLDLNREALVNQIHQGDYIPSPIRGKEIPKRNGKERLLGIPTARPYVTTGRKPHNNASIRVYVFCV